MILYAFRTLVRKIICFHLLSSSHKLCEVNNHKNVFEKLKFFFYSKTIYLIVEKVSEVFSTNERIIQVLVTTLCVSDSTFRTLQFVRFRSSVPMTELS